MVLIGDKNQSLTYRPLASFTIQSPKRLHRVCSLSFLLVQWTKMEATFFFYNIVACISSILAFLTNLCSLVYIKNTFDTRQSLYHILILDTKVVMVSAVIYLVWFFVNLADYQCEKISCSFLFLGSTITVLTSPLCNFMVSYIR